MRRLFHCLLAGTLSLACGLTGARAASAAPWAAQAAARGVQRAVLDSASPADTPIAGDTFLTQLARLDGTDAPAPDWAAALGLLPDGWTARDWLTRLDAARILTRYLDARGIRLPQSDCLPFPDLGGLPDADRTAITRLQQAGLFTGSSAGFAPSAPLTQAEAAVLLDRAWDVLTAYDSQLLSVPASDGYPLAVKLRVPARQRVTRAVVFANGSGPNTYDNTRTFGAHTMPYFDLYAAYFARAGAAFVTSSTRGVSPGPEAPLYCTIDAAAYQTYLPTQSVADVEAIVRAVRADDRLRDAEIWLLGWSEGTMIAPKVAQRGKVPVDGLLLAGYVHGTMAETLDWQQTGGASMVVYCQYFDTDSDGAVSQAEYEADPLGVRQALGLSEIGFADLDLDGDGRLTRADFSAMLAPERDALYDAIARRDDAWLAEHYAVRLTSAWFTAHEIFPPNREMLTALDLPIYIFQGECDANVSVQGARDAQAAFDQAGKDNLTLYTFPEHDHDLNAAAYFYGAPLSDGLRTLFRTLPPA